MATLLEPLGPDATRTRDALHRVATHVLARRRAALSGRFGLRATPGGFGTPAAGPEHEVVRIAGPWLVRERTGTEARTDVLDLQTASLAQAAAFADVDLDPGFGVGRDTPAIGDPDAPLAVDPTTARVFGVWFDFGTRLLDTLIAGLGPAATPSVLQLWPEHFDVGVDVGVDVAATTDRRANLGASAGDSYHDAPYLYVGPWGADRPGDPAYWNAPFGALLGYDDLRTAADSRALGREFVERGLTLLRAP